MRKQLLLGFFLKKKLENNRKIIKVIELFYLNAEGWFDSNRTDNNTTCNSLYHIEMEDLSRIHIQIDTNDADKYTNARWQILLHL